MTQLGIGTSACYLCSLLPTSWGPTSSAEVSPPHLPTCPLPATAHHHAFSPLPSLSVVIPGPGSRRLPTATCSCKTANHFLIEYLSTDSLQSPQPPSPSSSHAHSVIPSSLPLSHSTLSSYSPV